MFWRKNGHLIGVISTDLSTFPPKTHQHLVKCDSCACLCDVRTTIKKQQMIESGEYELVAESTDNFNCAEMSYDEEQSKWVFVRQSEGTLVQVMQRYPTLYIDEDGRFLYGREYFVSAVTMRNKGTGRYTTFGCKCVFSSSTHSCSHSFVVLNDYCITGAVAVMHLTSETELYSESMVCSPDPCDAGTTAMTALASWYGGVLHSRVGCIIDKSKGDDEIPNFIPFRMLWIYSPDGTDLSQQLVYTGKCIRLTCDCLMNTPPLTNGEYSSALMPVVYDDKLCDYSKCRNAEFLRVWAEHEGFDYHSSGALIHRNIGYRGLQVGEDQWCRTGLVQFELTSLKACACCAESERYFYYILCDECQYEDNLTMRIRRQDKWTFTVRDEEEDFDYVYWKDPDDPDVWQYLEGTVDCEHKVDYRVLIGLYPDLFGVDAISFGNNTIYRGVMTTDMGNGETVHTAFVDVCATHESVNPYASAAQDFFLDNRTMCWIDHWYDSNCVYRMSVNWVSPEGSPAGSSVHEHIFESITFLGKLEPFKRNSNLDWYWTGNVIEWDGGCQDYGYQCFETAEEAQQYSVTPQGEQCGACGRDSYDVPLFATRVSPPNKSITIVNGKTFYDDDRELYCATSPTYHIGASRVVEYESNGEWHQTTQYNIVYREQWIDSNLGLVRNGSPEPVASFTLYGIKDSSGNPNWGNCYQHSGVPSEDTTITSRLIDEDMHEYDEEEIVYQMFSEESDG